MGTEKDVRLEDVMSGQDRRIVERPEKLQKKKRKEKDKVQADQREF